MQTLIDGQVVRVYGHEFVASEILWLWDPMIRKVYARFTGTCTDAPSNDHIRHTSYNRGRYGGFDYAPPHNLNRFPMRER